MTDVLGVGSEIAGYRIESLIGRGGMAVVYRAEDTRLGRRVALKLLAPELSRHDQFRQRFVRESRLAASLDHPNIIPIFEAGDADGQLYLAMRYVVGSDLKQVLERDGRLEPGRALQLFAQMADALDAAHLLGLVHRDVKPANILVAPAREHEHVYLTDFGLTKRMSSLSGGLTGTGHFLGTIDYVAPEQISGKPVEPRTDIYALGCVLYECLTGQLPFHRDDDAALLWAHLVEAPPPVTAVVPDLPPEVDAVVAKAMAKAPEDRFESCRDLVLALQEALAVPVVLPGHHDHPRSSGVSAPGVPVQAEPESVAPAGQHPSFPPGVLPPPAEPVVTPDYVEPEAFEPEGEEAYEPEPEEEYEQEPPAPHAPAQRRRWLFPVSILAVLVLAAVVALLVLNGGSKGGLTQSAKSSTILPFSFRYPSGWNEADSGVNVVYSPVVASVEPLFANQGTGGTWAAVDNALRTQASKVVGLFTSFTSTQLDNSTVDALQQGLAPLLPATVTFSNTNANTLVGGFASNQLEGDFSDPAAPSNRLHFITYVVQVTQPQAESVQITFFAAPNNFTKQRALFTKIVKSVNFINSVALSAVANQTGASPAAVSGPALSSASPTQLATRTLAAAPATPQVTTTAQGLTSPASNQNPVSSPQAGTSPPPSPPPRSPSSAPGTATVPNVLGMTLNTAVAALGARGFHNIPYLYNCYGSSLIGDVVSQNPGAGAVVVTTSPISLHLQANNCATVPNVVGMTLTDAATTLKTLGFTNIPYYYECLGSSQIGKVIIQSPAPGTSYGKTQPVVLKLQANNC